ncbi:hypothetical protein Pmani_035710 [Petrolisthes manimaculis]|uniref:Uncharacterized protein n=1 Tax=Petrolisthes manimaculis TaxID=1843537 RepID=A0AAE1NLR0_9EUCA|nr:hypothetical protein Pmani_035710 [Petrolisthes manimaculis]
MRTKRRVSANETKEAPGSSSVQKCVIITRKQEVQNITNDLVFSHAVRVATRMRTPASARPIRNEADASKMAKHSSFLARLTQSGYRAAGPKTKTKGTSLGFLFGAAIRHVDRNANFHPHQRHTRNTLEHTREETHEEVVGASLTHDGRFHHQQPSPAIEPLNASSKLITASKQASTTTKFYHIF